MILAAALAAPAFAQPVSGAVKVGFADLFALHGCDGLYLRNQLSAPERAVTELLGRRGFHVLLSDSCRGADIHSALDWLAARGRLNR